MSQSAENFGGPTYNRRYRLIQRRPVFQKTTVYIVNGKEEMQNSLHGMTRSTQWETKIYSSAESFLDSFDPASPGCLLLDINVPAMGGLVLQAQLHAQHHLLPIIFASAGGTVPEAVQAFRAGAADFIIEPVRQRVLLARIRECVEKNQRDQEAQRQREEIDARITELTLREREVMDLVVRGTLNKVIASELNISVKTVEAHRSQVMKKLRAKNQAELIRLAIVSSGINGKINDAIQRI
jgi:RNA polymerase sigma factor (sigma-70 family)